MPEMKQPDENRLFITERLNKLLQRIPRCSLTVLEAPAGYGKTTAVHYALDEAENQAFWYTAVESAPDNSFRWFVSFLNRIDVDAAMKLSDLGYLNRSNADEAARIIGQIHAEKPVTLVFDNFQYAAENWQPQILDSLARNGSGLRTVFISQNFGRLRGILNELEESICFIRGRDLLLGERDVVAYAGLLGIRLTDAEAREIHRKTDGWAAAVALWLQSLPKEGLGGSDTVADLNTLLYESFWHRMTPPQRETLLRICPFDQISPSLMASVLPEGLLSPEEQTMLLRRSPLVRTHEVRQIYYPHELLLTFLRKELDEEEPAFREDVYRRAGRVFREKGLTREAVSCFYQAGDVEGILSCRLVCLITESMGEVSYTEVARTVLNRCSDELLQQYPLSALRLCYGLYAGCRFTEFDRQMERLYGLFLRMNDPQLMGEWYLVSALSDFPELDGMEKKYRQAERLLKSASRIFVKEEPFLFGCTSMWYLFFTRPGSMMATADRLAEVMKLYNRLTDGHGAGAAELYRGEALSVQGRFEESDIQAYQAAFLSEQSGNASATYGAALLLGINAVYSANMIGLQKAVDYLENKARGYSFLQGKKLNTYMVETVRGYLLGLMMETGRSALWAQGEADSLSDLTFTNFMVKTCRITDLLLKREYKQAIASVETSLQLDPRLISVSTRNFMYCGLALSYMAIGRMKKAAEYLDKSLTLAGQDQNYTFLACFRKYFQVLFLTPGIAIRHSRTISEIKALDIRYTRADESHIFAALESAPELTNELTPREREVAELAAAGLHNGEIAKRLCISEHTVKQHLKNAFQKMNIDRRSKLIEMLK